MGNVSIIKKIKLFLFYKKVINLNRGVLQRELNVRVDKGYRLYTVINIPPELIGENYTLKKSDIDVISTQYIFDFKVNLSSYLDSIGLRELYREYNIEKVAKFSYLVTFGYSLFLSNIVLLWIRVFGLILIALITFLIIFLYQ